MRDIVRIVALLAAGVGSSVAATPWNARSPLGINLGAVASYSTEQPFLNVFVTNDGWITHGKTEWDTGEEQYLQLDSNGYPKTLIAGRGDVHSPQVFNSVGVILQDHQGKYLYPAGKYVVMYDGKGKLQYGFDAKLISSSPGRDVIDVARPSAAGIELQIVATDPDDDGDYIRNIRVVRERNEAAFESGQVFDPAFLNLLKGFSVLRFMDWLETNGSKISSWSERPIPTYYSWAAPKGVPIEVAVGLANEVSANVWLNVPAMADDDYIRRMALLVHRELGASQKVYIEYSNEVWNSAFSQFRYASARGEAKWPKRPPGDAGYEWNRNWYGMRTAQMCDIWKSVWRHDRNRVICVLGAQAAYVYSATDSLNCPYWTAGEPCLRHGIDAVAIAPYFGDRPLPPQWLTQGNRGLALLFRSLDPPRARGTSAIIESFLDWATRARAMLARHYPHEATADGDSDVPGRGWLGEVSHWEKSYAAILRKDHLPLIAYEGGQSFVGGSSIAATNLAIAANRDPRMQTAYAEYLHQWKANGGELFVLYNDVGSYSRYGEWGALESLLQPREPFGDSPPKWRAIRSFITSTPCWWPQCASHGVDATGLPVRRGRNKGKSSTAHAVTIDKVAMLAEQVIEPTRVADNATETHYRSIRAVRR